MRLAEIGLDDEEDPFSADDLPTRSSGVACPALDSRAIPRAAAWPGEPAAAGDAETREEDEAEPVDEADVLDELSITMDEEGSGSLATMLSSPSSRTLAGDSGSFAAAEEPRRPSGDDGYHLADLVAGMLDDSAGPGRDLGAAPPRSRPAFLGRDPLSEAGTAPTARPDVALSPLDEADEALTTATGPGLATQDSAEPFADQPTEVIDFSRERPRDADDLAVLAGLPMVPTLPPEMQNANTVVLGRPLPPVPGQRGPARLTTTGQLTAARPGNGPLIPTGGATASGSGSGDWVSASGSGPSWASRSPSSLAVLPSAIDDSLIGTVVNDQYRVLRRIGVGGMGAVYLAEQLDVARLVALKVVSTQQGGDAGELEHRFRREAQAASKLNHPNIVTLYNFGRLGNGMLFIAMEYIEGISLAQLLKQEGMLGMVRTLDIAIQVCEGLAEAHSKGVVHRDLKPDNILLTQRRGTESAKLLDFGIAKIIDPNEVSTDITRAGLVRGTPIYMSPEQARGDFIDHRSDIYSFGVILYYMLTGVLPIRADTPFGYLHAHQHQRPQPLRQARLGLDLPLSLENLVMRCLMKQPAQRPASMGELEEGLRLIRAELLGQTPDPAWRMVKARRWPSGGKMLFWGAGAALLLLTAALVLLFAQPEEQKPVVVLSGAARATAPRVPPGPPPPPPPPREVAPQLIGRSLPQRPDWLEEPPLQMGDEQVAVGSSGPTANDKEAIAWAVAGAGDQLAHDLVAGLGQPGLALTIRGLAGQRRANLESRFSFEIRKLIATGPDATAEPLFSELRNGQEEVARRFDALLQPIGQDLPVPAPDIYWEHFRYVLRGEEGTFYRGWARRSLPPRVVHRMVATLTAATRILGLAAVEPYPIIAWGLQDAQGALVYSVVEGSPAAQSQILPGDLICTVDDQPIAGRAELGRQLRARQLQLQAGGGTIRLAVRRAGQGRFEIQLRIPRSQPAPGVARSSSTSGGGIDE